MLEKSLISPLIRAAWRQRKLLIWPLVVLIPLSFAVAWLTPRQYQASALVMLPETSGFGAGQSSYAFSQEMAAKMKGLDALLRSDYVLAEVLARGLPGETSSAPLTERIEDLRKRIGTKQVSDIFVQVTLNDSKKEGLAEKLNVVLASLFEGLLSPNQSANDAVSFVARQRQIEIEAIERKIKEVEAKEPKLTESMVREHISAGNSAEDRIMAKQRLLETDRARLQRDIENALGGAARTRDSRALPIEAQLGQLIAERRAQLDMLAQKGEAETDAARTIAGTIDKLAALASQQRDVNELAEEIRAERSRVASAQAMARNLASLMQERKLLYEEVDRARARHRQMLERLRGTGGPGALNLLRTPAQVQVIDMPSDPTRSITSRLKIIMIGLAAAFASSIGLATLAEQIDPKLRSAEQLRAVTNLPVIARLSHWHPGASPEDDDNRTRTRPKPTLHSVGSDTGNAGANVKHLRS
jgi:capsular polysaccharide biosynthesis protein